jgi:hypothetical protein
MNNVNKELKDILLGGLAVVAFTAVCHLALSILG